VNGESRRLAITIYLAIWLAVDARTKRRRAWAQSGEAHEATAITIQIGLSKVRHDLRQSMPRLQLFEIFTDPPTAM
jgi:hypothetical protein